MITEKVQDSANVIKFSINKRLSASFEVIEMIDSDQEDAILKYGYAIGYKGDFTDADSIKHSLYIIHLINRTTGVQIIMEITDELFKDYGKEFRSVIQSIREEYSK